ncbi:unnamed protein product [Clonostachys rosea f. rosea IK726]|uniref:Uncharacterized protein n=1 Tax=Clonostachys rosea f. rosea IK726 TaxID=1349383 RepID=A0ACA9TL87_BIOOC|nr:unnamed protein product [Clonostachys rosea f. rosea IK726]
MPSRGASWSFAPCAAVRFDLVQGQIVRRTPVGQLKLATARQLKEPSKKGWPPSVKKAVFWDVSVRRGGRDEAMARQRGRMTDGQTQRSLLGWVSTRWVFFFVVGAQVVPKEMRGCHVDLADNQSEGVLARRPPLVRWFVRFGLLLLSQRGNNGSVMSKHQAARAE